MAQLSTMATRLQKLNNLHAGRVIREIGYEVRSSNIRSQLGWSILAERRTNHKLTMMYKILRDEAPIYLKNDFILSNDGVYNLRGSNVNVILPKPKTNFLKKSFKFSGAKLWNNLPLNTKLQNTLLSFKRHIP